MMLLRQNGDTKPILSPSPSPRPSSSPSPSPSPLRELTMSPDIDLDLRPMTRDSSTSSRSGSTGTRGVFGKAGAVKLEGAAGIVNGMHGGCSPTHNTPNADNGLKQNKQGTLANMSNTAKAVNTPGKAMSKPRFAATTEEGEKQCTNCGETDTPQWRGTLCNACALWKRSRGTDRPSPLLFPRKRPRLATEDSEAGSSSRSGSGSPTQDGSESDNGGESVENGGAATDFPLFPACPPPHHNPHGYPGHPHYLHPRPHRVQHPPRLVTSLNPFPHLTSGPLHQPHPSHIPYSRSASVGHPSDSPISPQIGPGPAFFNGNRLRSTVAAPAMSRSAPQSPRGHTSRSAYHTPNSPGPSLNHPLGSYPTSNVRGACGGEDSTSVLGSPPLDDEPHLLRDTIIAAPLPADDEDHIVKRAKYQLSPSLSISPSPPASSLLSIKAEECDMPRRDGTSIQRASAEDTGVQFGSAADKEEYFRCASNLWDTLDSTSRLLHALSAHEGAAAVAVAVAVDEHYGECGLAMAAENVS